MVLCYFIGLICLLWPVSFTLEISVFLLSLSFDTFDIVFCIFDGFFMIFILLYILWQYQRYSSSFSHPTNRLGYFFRHFFKGSASNEFLPFYTLPSLLPLRTHYTFFVRALILPFLHAHSFYLFLYALSYISCMRTHLNFIVIALILQFLYAHSFYSFYYVHLFYLFCTCTHFIFLVPALILSFLSVVISAS